MSQSSPNARTVQAGVISGTIFDFPDADCVLEMHAHTEADVHISIVARGRFAVTGCMTLTAECGAWIDWKPGQMHEFRALEPNSRLINLLKAAPNANDPPRVQ